jgi:hypothetical protein
MEYESTLGLGLRPCRVKEKEKKNSRDVFVAKKSVCDNKHAYHDEKKHGGKKCIQT